MLHCSSSHFLPPWVGKKVGRALPIPLPFPSLIDFEFGPPIAGSLLPCVSCPLHLFTALCPFLESWGIPSKRGAMHRNELSFVSQRKHHILHVDFIPSQWHQLSSLSKFHSCTCQLWLDTSPHTWTHVCFNANTDNGAFAPTEIVYFCSSTLLSYLDTSSCRTASKVTLPLIMSAPNYK